MNAASIVFVVQIELQIKQRCHPTCWGYALICSLGSGFDKVGEMGESCINYPT